MSQGSIVGICIGETMFSKMSEVQSVVALAGQGLEGDRYCSGQGRFNRDRLGHRQVTLMNARFFQNSAFGFADSRRNIFVQNVELMWLIGRQFRVGDAILEGVSYCDPCNLPSKRAGIDDSFQKTFEDCGGLIAKIIETGRLSVGDSVVPPPKGY